MNKTELVTEREVVFTGGIDTTKSHNLAAKCHDTRSAFYMTRYFCSIISAAKCLDKRESKFHKQNTATTAQSLIFSNTDM